MIEIDTKVELISFDPTTCRCTYRDIHISSKEQDAIIFLDTLDANYYSLTSMQTKPVYTPITS